MSLSHSRQKTVIFFHFSKSLIQNGSPKRKEKRLTRLKRISEIKIQIFFKIWYFSYKFLPLNRHYQIQIPPYNTSTLDRRLKIVLYHWNMHSMEVALKSRHNNKPPLMLPLWTQMEEFQKWRQQHNKSHYTFIGN